MTETVIELPAQPLNSEDRAYLISEAAVTEEFLDENSHLVRSVETSIDLRLGVERDPWSHLKCPARGQLYCWYPLCEGSEPKFQYRPAEPGEHGKYQFEASHAPSYGVVLRGSETGTVYLVEGFKKALAAAATLGLSGDTDTAVIALPGCSAWSQGEWSPDPALTGFVAGRDVLVFLDADAATNPDVYAGGERLHAALDGAAECVRFAQVPGGGKNGLDDYLTVLDAGKRPSALERLCRKAITGKPSPKRPVGKKNKNTDGDGADDGWMFTESGKLRPDTIARHILVQYPVAATASHELAVYDNGVYTRHPAAVKALVGGLLKDQYNTGNLTNITGRLEGLCFEERRVLPDRASEPLLNCKNGMLDLHTLELKPHDPKHLSARQIPVAWDPDATCPTYDAWLEGRVGKAQVPVVNEAISQFLDPSRTPAKALFLFGPSRSGKSTILRLATELVGGEESVSGVSLQDLGDDHFAAAELFGKPINVCADLPRNHVSDVSVFKRVTGDDPITANKKYGAMFTFRSNSLFLLSANTIPTVAGDDISAYLNRVVPVVFPKTYAGREDSSIEDAMMKELPGILATWVRARRAHMERTQWTPPHPAVWERFSGSVDRVAQFLSTCCDVGGTTFPFNPITTPGTSSVPRGRAVWFPGQRATLTQLHSAFLDWSLGGADMAFESFKERVLNAPGVRNKVRDAARSGGRTTNVVIKSRDDWGSTAKHSDLIDILFPDEADDPVELEDMENVTPITRPFGRGFRPATTAVPLPTVLDEDTTEATGTASRYTTGWI
ncbi:DNA primase family protein [Mycobacteroides abscessus]|uniref:DNA primase family protein n=1 Tax=Mycobacteroides abscessus TaxID=36809 RepID=UPI000927E306|nr:phage/plasmid primase, P4 family [Mycobacteroides abscessus]SHX81974.1 phage/plasmid primase, P4 family, C-terminal domain protein [Mycobacteroides abscessus subsp. abscessus]SKM69858.1 phage/plasmid primase, P4 family, C-terminal domain protein [Mycobacteroides abscessus subsp. abscessus]SKN72965.1 phage/plasmid primase, P4 family, C-terminal domain protein [Mycobacteroides abscessus subsp. abscessus]SKR46539.1 bacteriophage protein [Mycobacteroides abscessus subsp. abscessus]SKR63013.1 ba